MSAAANKNEYGDKEECRTQINSFELVGLEIFTAVTMMMMMMFWVLAPSSLIGRCQRLGGTSCLHLQN
jgi:hypothetical protein